MRQVPFVDRVVEVIADREGSAGGRYSYGSGCIVAGRTVLTAAHVTTGAQTVWVRDANKVQRPATLDSRFVGDVDGPGPDLALLEIDDSAVEVPALPLAIVDRDSPLPEVVDRCHAIGYPWFAVQRSPKAVRDTAHAYGYIPVLSKLARGLLSLHVSGPPRPLPPESDPLSKSEWSGMSGAPVVAAGHLLGVVIEHAPREGPSSITIAPLSGLESDPDHRGWGPGVTDPTSWWARMGVPGLGALERLPPRRERPEPAYRTTLRRIQTRTRELRGRKRAIQEIAAFATSSEGYRWYVGSAWTGKTTLLASSIAPLPDVVQVVAYFMSRVEADADSNKFLSAVVPQLADLLDEDPPVIDRHHFDALWERAASAAASAQRHLLLIVDGLDEDLHPPGSLSVASLLPTTAGGRTHVLVSSRPNPDLPTDAQEHPLCWIERTGLKPFKGAAGLAALAKKELIELKRRDDDGLATDVLAILTAAAGPLAVEDLANLTSDTSTTTPAHTRRVRRLVSEDAARSLEAIGSTTSRRYEFAHPSLLEYAQSDEDLSDPAYRDRIHQWAEEWAEAGWPAGTEPGSATPLYLLDAYPSTLSRDREGSFGIFGSERLGELVGDIGWLDTAIARVGVDSVLASLRTAAQTTQDREPVVSVLRVVEDQAHHLRRPNVDSQFGYGATLLAWRALTLGFDGLVTGAAARLRGLPAPQLVPTWTTERSSPYLIAVLGRHGGPVWALTMTGEGLVVSGGDDGTVRMWDPRVPGDPGRLLGRHNGWVNAVAVTGEGLIVSGGDDGAVRLQDSRVLDDPGRLLGRHDGSVNGVAVTGEGLVVSGGDDGAVRLWDPRVPDDPGRDLGRHDGSVNAVAVTGEGLIVSGDDDGAVRLWDPRVPDDPGHDLGRHDGAVRAVAVTGEGLIVSGDDDGAVRLWDPRVPDDPGRDLGRHDGAVRAVAVTGEGLIVSGGDDGAVRFWDPCIDTGRVLGRHDGSVNAVAITGEGLVASAGYDGAVRFWDPGAAEDPGRELGRHDGAVWAVAVTGEGLIVSGGADGAVRLWDPRIPDDPGRVLGRHDSWVNAVVVTAEGLVISGGSDLTVRLWHPGVADDPGRELGRDDGSVTAVAVTGDGLVVSGGANGAVRLWDPRIPDDPGPELARHDGSVDALEVSGDGQLSVVTHGGIATFELITASS